MWLFPNPVTAFTLRLRQFSTLTLKNLYTARRKKTLFLVQVVIPLIFIALLKIIAVVSGNSLKEITSPNFTPISAFGRCTTDGSTSCISLIYGADDEQTVFLDIAQTLISQAGLTDEGSCTDLDLSGPAREFGACRISIGDTAGPSVAISNFLETLVIDTFPVALSLSISTNALQPSALVFFHSNDEGGRMRATQLATAWTRAMVGRASGSDPQLNVRLGDFLQPSKELPDSNPYLTAVTLFFLIPVSLGLIFSLVDIVFEKEHELRKGLNMVGLKDATYLFSAWFFWAMIGVLVSFLIYLLGLIINIPIMRRCNFFVFMLAFVLAYMAHTSVAIIFSVIPTKTRSAANLGFAYLVLIIFVSLFFAPAFIYLWWTQDIRTISVLRVIFYFFPFFHFSKIIGDITYVTASTADGYFAFGDLYKPPQYATISDTPDPNNALLWLLLQTVAYGILGWYLDAVLDNASGARRHPAFFLFPSYWGIHMISDVPLARESNGEAMGVDRENDHEDVVAEAEAAFDPTTEAAIRVKNLHVTYGSLLPWRSDVRAVRGLSFTVKPRTCFSMLGHNGAGKTTALSTMLGLFPATRGTIDIFGQDTRTHLSAIQEVLGVCPQFEILWPFLTGREHLRFFALFRGVPIREVAPIVDELLRAVGLTYAANRPSHTYSGGMRRRLALAVAMIAEPQLILLDEPSSGLDVANRRKVWDLILRLKRTSLVVLVSHAMQEVETLADTVLIMAHGRARAFGTPLRLKNQWGKGYRITIEAVSPKRLSEVRAIVQESMGDTMVHLENQGNFAVFQVGRGHLGELATFFEQLDASMTSSPATTADVLEPGAPAPGTVDAHAPGQGASAAQYDGAFPIIGYSISISSLEEVFLRIADEEEEHLAHDEAARGAAHKPDSADDVPAQTLVA